MSSGFIYVVYMIGFLMQLIKERKKIEIILDS
jgi:hypothetical protein